MFDFAKSRAPRTTELYVSCFGDWEEWCSLTGASAIPARVDDVLAFLIAREPTHSTSALSARKSAIVAAHRDARSRLDEAARQPYMLENDDKLKPGWKEILRRKGNRHTPREAVCSPELLRIIDQIPLNLAGTMARAILLTGMAGALRRSEIAALNREDIEIMPDAMFIHVRRSKTDQTGIGVTLKAKRSGKATCPVTAMEKWIVDGDIESGPLFRHPRFKESRRIAPTLPYVLIKRYGALAGLNAKKLGAHSLRRGFVTEVLRAKIPLPDSMAAARHKTASIHLSYGEAMQNNSAVDVLGL